MEEIEFKPNVNLFIPGWLHFFLVSMSIFNLCLAGGTIIF